jgi:hypothetical protein
MAEDFDLESLAYLEQTFVYPFHTLSQFKYICLYIAFSMRATLKATHTAESMASSRDEP